MPTTSQGIYYPDSATNVTPLHTVLATMASSIDTILDGDTQIHRVANTTARAALAASFSPTAAKPLFVWRADAPNGRELEYTKNGTTWYHYRSTEDDTGWVSVPALSGFTSAVSVRVKEGLIFYQGSFSTSSGNLAIGTAYTVGTTPVGFRPVGSTTFAIGFGGTTVGAANINATTGVITVRPNSVTTSVNMGSAPPHLPA